MKIAFIHPDLGIGGAERLVVDAAVGLQSLGHEVTIYTSYHDKNHSFDETNDGTLKVIVEGNKIVPPKIFGRLAILCASLRQLHLTRNLINSSVGNDYDVFIVDQLSICVPIIRFYLKGRILFYCHFPDQLLTQRKSTLKKLYRVPFDWLESWSTGIADVILVNSKFTRSVFQKTFSGVKRLPEVIYPSVDTEQSGKALDSQATATFSVNDDAKVILSINRFERKKNIELALRAFAIVARDEKSSVLYLAGGYDPRVDENIGYLKELQSLSDELGLSHTTIFPSDTPKKEKVSTRVVFLPSVASSLKTYLLKNAHLLLYTPSYEHFGIVPLEAMVNGTPVLATDTGGPLETVVNGVTGWNRPSDPTQWAKVIKYVVMVMSPEARELLSSAAKKRVKDHFSTAKMAKEFEYYAIASTKVKRQDIAHFGRFIDFARAILVVLIVVLIVSIFNFLGHK
ncbi:GDP-Man:Man(1)GlcNAc(2)-PP-dolichol alpha-1,3-mannosyltransferase [Sugiyamaella lignohabitans]|uniref:Alpha-1,3/1,6-mannosyltransferase ALG2 n=1 Tax=Sugiyamaella lignohabitans TaxID=796027 RepID=A0A167FFL3_9ASCO|nr:GDP-Man:Man(1)GlcNAc(2)-PP-dolichol alpha-1,3-mannosyltransferase [Sugiyamaella lignohabitans]ANB15239.1 GDP-Man:Man(1)GlcNAc(2)-PP-dolichol alpha-1,3-mannosyltransferase [Sugiyamaella lignohabitans]